MINRIGSTSAFKSIVVINHTGFNQNQEQITKGAPFRWACQTLRDNGCMDIVEIKASDNPKYPLQMDIIREEDPFRDEVQVVHEYLGSYDPQIDMLNKHMLHRDGFQQAVDGKFTTGGTLEVKEGNLVDSMMEYYGSQFELIE